MTETALDTPRTLLGCRPRGVWPFVIALALLVFAVAAALAFRAYGYRNEVLPGVRVAGTELGGAGRRAAAAEIRHALAPSLGSRAIVLAGGHRLGVELGDVFTLDARASAERGLRAGRASLSARAASLLWPRPIRHDVTPVFRERPVGASALLARLEPFAQPPIPARVRLVGLRPVVVHGRVGTRLDSQSLIAGLERRASGSQAEPVRARFVPAPPPVGVPAATEAASTARRIVAAPVALSFRGRELGSLPPWRLARLLRFRITGARYAVTLDRRALERLLQPRLGLWLKRAQNARLVITGSRVHVRPSRFGIGVDTGATATAILRTGWPGGVRTAALALHRVAPDLTTREASALGIRRRLVSYTTEMGPSSSNRIHNVHLMADFIDGTIVRPGETFSFNRVVGPRTAARGFLEGQMIVGSLLLPAIGGGVCQTATTLFNGAFELGLPIVERHNHGFYISHYPLGRDATVSWGGPDLVFQNDFQRALLIKTSYTDSTLTFTWYGTPEGRKVVSTTGAETNWRAPTMSYAVDPKAPPRSVRVENGTNESGFDVTVYRKVYEHGRLLRQAAFKSRYIPVGPTTVYGPGRTPPGPYFVLPSS